MRTPCLAIFIGVGFKMVVVGEGGYTPSSCGLHDIAS